MREKERLIFISGLSTLGLLAIAFSAFTRDKAREIFKRDNGQCQDSGKRFDDGWMLHASHYDHSKNSNYNNIDNGRMQGVEEHQTYHEDHVGSAEEIGLTEEKNNRAIDFLKVTDRRTRKWMENNGNRT